MHLYRLVGRAEVSDFGADPVVVHTCIIAVNVLWPDPLTPEQVEAHVMGDLLHDFSHDVDWEWTVGPEVREITTAEMLQAAGVPDLFCGEVANV